MPATRAPKERAPRRQWPPAEKRRSVELTLRAGASVVAVAREHEVNPNSLYWWKRLYGAGKLDAQVKSSSRVAGPAASATFVPVSLVAWLAGEAIPGSPAGTTEKPPPGSTTRCRRFLKRGKPWLALRRPSQFN